MNSAFVGDAIMTKSVAILYLTLPTFIEPEIVRTECVFLELPRALARSKRE